MYLKNALVEEKSPPQSGRQGNLRQNSAGTGSRYAVDDYSTTKTPVERVRRVFEKDQSPLQESGYTTRQKLHPEKQKEYLEKEMQPRLDKAQAKKGGSPYILYLHLSSAFFGQLHAFLFQRHQVV